MYVHYDLKNRQFEPVFVGREVFSIRKSIENQDFKFFEILLIFFRFRISNHFVCEMLFHPSQKNILDFYPNLK